MFLTYGLMFGAAGGISGITTALLIARAESGRDFSELPPWRLALWGFLGGSAPGVAFLGIAVALGTTDVLGLLAVVGGVSGGLGGLLTGAAAAAAKRVGPGHPESRPELPA